MVFAGKVYETDGANAIAVHEADAIRPLSPVPLAPSLRIFRNDLQPSPGPETEDPSFFYGNPLAIVGTNQLIQYPGFTKRVAFEPYVAAVLVSQGYRVDQEVADDMILGITVLSLLTAPDAAGTLPSGAGALGRSIDLGAGFGPVLTTPDELDDFLVDQQFGRRYRLEAVARINGVERSRGNLEHLPWTFAEAITSASQSCTVREGDIFVMGPIVDTTEPLFLEEGDEYQIAVENLGTLSLKLSQEL